MLLELRIPIKKATLVYCDNVNAIYLSGNPETRDLTTRALSNFKQQKSAPAENWVHSNGEGD